MTKTATVSAPDSISLPKLAEGALCTMFEEQLERVLANVVDPSTAADAKRSIRLQVIFKPDDDRRGIDLLLSASSSLAPSQQMTRIEVGRSGSQVIAIEQPGLFDGDASE